jgi:hypothetical protein
MQAAMTFSEALASGRTLLADGADGLPFLRGTIVGDWTFMAVLVVTVGLVRHAAHARLNWLVTEARA